MRMTKAQIGVRLICGQRLPPPGEARIPKGAGLTGRIALGRDLLKELSQQDFGYDLVAWHAYLKESRDGGYTWGRNIVLPRVMHEALASAEWREAVRKLEAPSR